ncbi:DUF429 domain-containing protein [Rhizobium sp. CFBP 8752]|uniref:DUF429 domain-containing protein n=1 Tax=Rhizobium sp. CFBP 8752 TaxID=2775301 RepID=UPI00177CA0B7|nr:DUF429 domain-containing protein [Rhizobium sp. CFBP 8752]MBD8664105.1 DUF429 domain-containing protein [Rhizobium sp. CFBP 8752]
MNVAVVAHCDWSMDRKKRWMAVAIRDGVRWQMHAPELVGDTSTLIDRMKARSVEKGALLLGFDFPIGLPMAYARATELGSFREALASFGSGIWSDWYSVADHRSRISLHRPFYPARPGGTQRAHLFDALGVTDPHALLRLCERAAPDRQAACMLFWTLGGNQVGKGAITGWREMIVPRLDDIGLWPFDGNLIDLLDTRSCVIAETYPGDVYRQLGMPRSGWSKRRQVDRQRIAKMMIPWLEARPDIDAHAFLPMIEDGFGADKSGEDRFDAAVGLFGMLDVVDGRRDEGVPDVDGVRRWEGWILGHHRNDAH